MLQVSATTSLAQNPQINEYSLKGGVTIRDKTNGIAKAIFSEELAKLYQKPAYQIFINNKKIIFPTFSNPLTDPDLTFTSSLRITFKLQDAFIKIIEVDETSKNVFYVDPRKAVFQDSAYDVYTYIPKELTFHEASKKIQNLSEFKKFKPDMAAYNRHGVVVFGCEDGQGYTIYWANPHEEKVKKIENATCMRYRDGGTSVAKSNDGTVHFRYLINKGFYLNAELATRILLKNDKEGSCSSKKKIDGDILEEKDSKKAKTAISYVDPKSCIQNIADKTYTYIPKELTFDEAFKKIQNLLEFKKFESDMAAYNRHGVAVFGWENDQGYALYWANPHEEKIKKMENAKCVRYRDGGTSIATSNDGVANFHYVLNKGFYLNAELATEISLKDYKGDTSRKNIRT